MDAPVKKAPAPPYVPYKTLRNFLDRFKQGVPGRIDRGLMGSMSGAVQSQVKTALRYLGLISEHDIPSELMKRICASEGEERQQALRTVLKAAYPYIFGEQGLDFSTATGSQLREVIEHNTTASGETLNRCMAFLKEAAEDAGVAISPYFTGAARNGSARKQRTATPKKRTDAEKRPENPESGGREHHDPPHVRNLPTAAAQESLLLWGLFQRLPKPGSVWPKAQREQWLQTLQNVIGLEYQEEGQ